MDRRKMNHKMYPVLVALLAIIGTGISAQEYAPVVNTQQGKIRGLVHSIDQDVTVHFYKGIRYGVAERFGKPHPIPAWDGIYDATKDGNSCVQFIETRFNMDKYYPTNKSEDCLFLNVFKPVQKEESDGKLLPVMVWIYGGGFQMGTIFTPFYDGSVLATKGNLIVVTINYRLGPFGYLFAGTDDAPGNQGIHDQILGLEWVRDNIENFGGDPKQVTIFGESAGSMAVSILVLTPKAKGLFQRAIMQSGSMKPSARILPRDVAFERTHKFAKKLNCDSEDMEKVLKCLREKSMEEIRKAGLGTTAEMLSTMIAPMVGDDEILPEDVAQLKRGFNEVDLMFGVTKNEGSLFLPDVVEKLNENPPDKERAKEIIINMMNYFKIPEPEEIAEFYLRNIESNDKERIRMALSDFFGDFRFVCPTTLFGKELALRSDSSTKKFFAYRFDRRAFAAEMMNCENWMGVCHAAEIPYVFGISQIKFFPKDHQLSKDMIRAWTNFARSGEPGPMGSIEWPQALDNDQHVQAMSLNIEYSVLSGPFRENCEELWNRKYPNWYPVKNQGKIEL